MKILLLFSLYIDLKWHKVVTKTNADAVKSFHHRICVLYLYKWHIAYFGLLQVIVGEKAKYAREELKK